MGFFRFRRSVRILPGIRINLGKRSGSVSVGVRGAHVTFGGPRGTRATVGLPGTGLSYTSTSNPHPQAKPVENPVDAPPQPGRRAPLRLIALLLLAAFLVWLALTSTAHATGQADAYRAWAAAIPVVPHRG